MNKTTIQVTHNLSQNKHNIYNFFLYKITVKYLNIILHYFLTEHAMPILQTGLERSYLTWPTDSKPSLGLF